MMFRAAIGSGCPRTRRRQHAACSKESDAAALAVDGSPAEADLLQRLRAGDRAAFAEIVQAWSAMLLRVALLYVSTRASAEEVVRTPGWP
jgi:hypothetical protein